MNTKPSLRVTLCREGGGAALARFVQPFPDGFLRPGEGLAAREAPDPISLRVLTRHPQSGCARTAIVSLRAPFDESGSCPLTLESAPARAQAPFSVELLADDAGVTVKRNGFPDVRARLIAPALHQKTAARVETAEENAHCVWKIFTFEDEDYARALDVRAFSDGTVCVMCTLSRGDGRDGFCPPFGFEIPGQGARILPSGACEFAREDGFARLPDGARVSFPMARFQLCGALRAEGEQIVYLRATGADFVPMQPYSRRRAAFVWQPEGAIPLDETLRPQIRVRGNEPIYLSRMPEEVDASALEAIAELREASRVVKTGLYRMSLRGHDFGNVTKYNFKTGETADMGANRLNIMGDLFGSALCGGDEEMLREAVCWAYNYNDLTVWWGKEMYGGTRYPWPHLDKTFPQAEGECRNTTFVWRSNEGAYSFSHKGFSHFFTAYEQTGDPALLAALRAQTQYAMDNVHVRAHCVRNSMVIRDFTLLYEWTGEKQYLDKALCMYRDFQPFENEEGLFSENGMRVDGREGFIQNDAEGYRYGYAKPYILGYGLVGLCALRRVAGNLEGMDARILGMARFLARAQDACGTMRYPHPRSGWTLLFLEVGQQMLMALQTLPDMDKADRDELLDAIGAMLHTTMCLFRETGRVTCGVSAWEVETGLCTLEALKDLYKTPAERDRDRDFIDGGFNMGGYCQPEGLVSFENLAAYYVRARGGADLLAPPRGQTLLLMKLARKFVREHDQKA